MANIVPDAVGILALPAQAVAEGQGRGGCQHGIEQGQEVGLGCRVRVGKHADGKTVQVDGGRVVHAHQGLGGCGVRDLRAAQQHAGDTDEAPAQGGRVRQVQRRQWDGLEGSFRQG